MQLFQIRVVRHGLHGAFGGGDHLFHALAAAGDQLVDDLGLGQVLPILLRHLGLHGLHLQPRGIEDAAVIGAPEVVVRVGIGHFALGNAGAEGEVLAVPVGAFVRGQNGPVHAGEALAKERRGELDDAILGLKPSHELLALRGFIHPDEPEADKGMHLVDVAPDGLGPDLALARVGVGRMAEQMALATPGEPIEQAVKDGKAACIGMRADTGGQVQELRRHLDVRGRSGRVGGGLFHEQRRGLGGIAPIHVLGANATLEKLASLAAPGGKGRLDGGRDHSCPLRAMSASCGVAGGGALKFSSSWRGAGRNRCRRFAASSTATRGV